MIKLLTFSEHTFIFFSLRSIHIRHFGKFVFCRDFFLFFQDEIVEEVGFSRSTIEHMKSIFELFDINGDGDICITELERVTKALGHTPPR